ncbi:hypothetical protein CANARDRAFT_209663 [[Candida] arabinofermentans NRRL YB-2248]|uniref:Uncharacterized protein n=1 Tax=[Candida] arabinofermentans NRRL YB-2248 TaxID=983967 RepID=A0A1E4STK5_9ASCO|nr:hypothetical protein CANARDRAFT_209663 [[Candida] arabinofermentans NRRL YB-2248]
MSKSIAATGDFARLFKTTKLAQLPNRLGDLGYDKAQAYPTHQIIESLPSSFSRKDFGLKVRLPKTLKTKHIIVNDLDNKYQLPDFEPLNNFYYKKLKFQELGIPVSTINDNQNNIQSSSFLFPKKKSTNNDNDKKTIADILSIPKQSTSSKSFQSIKNNLRSLRQPFKEWLVQHYPERISSEDLTSEIVEFLQSTNIQNELNLNLKKDSSSPIIPSSYASGLSGTAGLSYNLKGRLFQTPNGAISKKVVPGRLVKPTSTGVRFGLGGFIGQSSINASQVPYLNDMRNTNRPLNNKGQFSREFKIPLIAKDVTLNLDTGRLKFDIQAVKVRRDDSSFGSRNGSLFQRKVTRRVPLGGNEDGSGQSVLNSLLGMLNMEERKK